LILGSPAPESLFFIMFFSGTCSVVVGATPHAAQYHSDDPAGLQT
jgi:hypothetical protein